FKVETKPVDSGSGTVEVKWTGWGDASKLTNMEVELYSVMRAEKYYIGKGAKKLASKYVRTFSNKGKVITVENCGVDNFFRNLDGTYLFCESKFTRDVAKFASWKT